MKLDFDYIVIGSGFGGSVMTCRLVEKGYKVCLLERGRQWKMHEFPRRPQEVQQNMFWDPQDNKYGLMEIRDTPGSDVMTLTGSGLGGGSLIFANVMYRMPADFFHGWPSIYSRESLDPYYDRVLETMEAEPYPFESQPYYRNTPKTAALKKAAEEMPWPEGALKKPEFVLPPLAVRFKGNFPGHQTRNKHGALQSKCNKCGDCDIGCNIHAKNTLDLNYIHRARHLESAAHKADVRTHAEVTRIEHCGDYYKVTYVIPEFPAQENVFTAKNVVVSAGSIGSTSLLLKMKKQGHLPRLNHWLGKKWSGNGDLLAWVFNTKNDIDATNGPVITGAIEYSYKTYPDGYPHGMYIEEAGYPIGIAWYLSGRIPQLPGLAGFVKLLSHSLKKYIFKNLKIDGHDQINVGDEISRSVDRADFTKKCLILLGMGRDRADGEIELRDDNQAVVRWKIDSSQTHFSRVREQMKVIAEHAGGVFVENPYSHLNKIISVHPLGGCPMGETADHGFVSPLGEVYGYPGLYVIDGSILPTSSGTNPSLTIAAVAEYIASKIPSKVTVPTHETENA
ncbi:GMC family oxidoreductase [Bdellovibrio sp. 22V]|uniref:GMC oxidoreductase n=1 Tax=Bdellovibrio TaxID=958 RepID=UPI0025436CD5|nr:GMC family oxidoreductase [Bdellovibrio sp. 22V]WII73527.1 GMC family oxidoreductase [Bdellovibrio sp. 22V]